MPINERWKWWRDPEFWVLVICGVIILFLAVVTKGEYLWPWLGAQ